jgi:hypothetical protein
MAKMGKHLTKCLVLSLVVTSLIMAIPTKAQKIPTPAVPEFSIMYIDNSFNAPNPTLIYDQYGNSREVEGYVENKTAEFTIKNQAFIAYTIPYNSNDPANTGQTVHIMYNIRMKSASYSDWQYITHKSDGYLAQSNSSQTIASFPLDYLFPLGIPNNEAVSFQVQALIGYVHRYPVIASYTFNGTQSDWSPIQTIVIPATATTRPSPSVPEFPITATLVAVLVVVSLLLIIGKRKPAVTDIQ